MKLTVNQLSDLKRVYSVADIMRKDEPFRDFRMFRGQKN
jgi:hypothetical protein